MQSFVLELWRNLLALVAVAGNLDFSEVNTAQQLSAQQLVGSVCTTRYSAAGLENRTSKLW